VVCACNLSLLDNSCRGALEHIIDDSIIWIPQWVPEFNREESKRLWMYDKSEDFIMGLTIGVIYAQFEASFKQSHQRQLDPQERTEEMLVIHRRLPQIREALFRGG
jgi:hypothetical protein